ncbi:hypothetical protein [Acidisphaera rubrifaciens]|uniref:Phasin domain-containing protein n=1 Tax=Acidisphaera rubrifaciens HS-AP3 TaxID=1231350 RepID=A0A0D6P5L3_9PROT|nr:hypothetical protein [Acidisphaera rubrifaciens]GAN76493.1 hypothetical protein Asru_0104_16 [Acidisphaera rubrifaciens HS-AP3]
MSDATIQTGMIRPEAAIAGAQRGLACWSRAYTELAHGLMEASLAQFDLVRSIYGSRAAEWSVPPTARPHDAALRSLTGMHARYDITVDAYRRINDRFAEHVFAAAEALVDAFEDGTAPLAATAPTTASAGAVAAPTTGAQKPPRPMAARQDTIMADNDRQGGNHDGYGTAAGGTRRAQL